MLEMKGDNKRLAKSYGEATEEVSTLTQKYNAIRLEMRKMEKGGLID